MLELHKTQIVLLDVSQNELTVHSMKKFAVYISAYQASKELQSVSLDKNDLHDDGIREIINGLIDRFNN